jgi:hypothetical protein
MPRSPCGGLELYCDFNHIVFNLQVVPSEHIDPGMYPVNDPVKALEPGQVMVGYFDAPDR